MTLRISLLVPAARDALKGIHHAPNTREALAVAAKGATKYLAAIARGDVCTEEIQAMRLATCKRCPWLTTDTAPGALAPSSWCGKPLAPNLHERTPPGERTCGCLIPLKITVASERCPQDRWTEEPQESDNGRHDR